MLYIQGVTLKSSFRIHLWFTMVAIISMMFFTPNVIFSAEKHYYYLHVSSFRLEERAVKNAETLRSQGYDVVIRHERLLENQYWYRVYIGPFSSLQEARSKKEELISRKLTDYAAIKKKEYLIKSDIGKPPEKEEIKVALEPKKELPKVSLPQEVTPTMPEEPVEAPPAPEKPPAAKEIPAPIPSMEEREVVKAPPPTVPPRPPVRISKKPPRKKEERAPKGSGRNMGQGNFALGLRHTYREVPLELTKRTQITSDGTTTTTEEVSVTSGEKEDFSTRLHMDSLRIRFGLTNYLEIFAEIDGAYRELSNLGLAYGGGLRLNLFQVRGGWLKGFYSALQGEYVSGEVEYEYSSSADNKWKKKADWGELIAKGELGFVGSRFSTYVGAAYFDYREDTERELLENLPSSLTSFVLQDELEEKESFGAFGGIDINLSSAVLVNIEGQVITQKSIFGTLEYHF
jgi:hypothetical protein